MKLAKIEDMDAFFKIVDSCKGKVELVSREGDRLNLKSKLNQYVSLAKIASDKGLGRLEVIAENLSDAEKLMEFMRDIK